MKIVDYEALGWMERWLRVNPRRARREAARKRARDRYQSGRRGPEAQGVRR